MEGLEDDALLIECDSDAGIGDFERDHRRRSAENRMIFAPSSVGHRNGKPHRTVLGELERIRQQILEHLLQTLGVRHQAASEMRIGLHLERQLPIFRFVPERPRHHLQQVGEEDFLGFDRHRARFDLRQIENVADQVQQVGSRAVNGARKLHLLGRQVVIGIFAELLAQHQNAVQRRAQLVRHVGQEFRLVLGSERQFFCLLFQRAPRLLDFLVLAFHFDVLFGQLLRFLRQLLVGLLQFFLLRLQFGGQLLRLLQQAFRLHRGFNTVQHDADAGGELLQECQVRRGERIQRRQFDHRLHPIFEQHRQHDDVARNSFKQSRTNRNRLFRQVGNQHAAFFCRALADQSFADLQAAQVSALAVIGKGRKQHHACRTLPFPSGRSRPVAHSPAAPAPTATCGPPWPDRAGLATCR